MPALSSYDYAVVRVVPRVERGEFVNVGVILICRTRRYLTAQIELNPARLLALAPQADLKVIEDHLAVIPIICRGGPASGPIGQLSQAERFHWLVAPRSSIIQVSPAHTGLCREPEEVLQHLLDKLVRWPV